MEWGKFDKIDISDQAARLYQLWLNDVKSEAPGDSARDQVDPVRFAAPHAAIWSVICRRTSARAMLDDLARVLGTAELDQAAIMDSTKRLQRYLAGEDQPADTAEVQREYRRRVCRYRLLADNGLTPRPKGKLYDQLLRVAFGPALTYTGYREIEESRGRPAPHVAEVGAGTVRNVRLARFDPRPHATGRLPRRRCADGWGRGACRRTARGVDRRREVADVGADARGEGARRGSADLRASSINPGAPLAEHGYLVSACEYAYRNDPGAQVRQLRRVLSIAFDPRSGRLGLPEIDMVSVT